MYVTGDWLNVCVCVMCSHLWVGTSVMIVHVCACLRLCVKCACLSVRCVPGWEGVSMREPTCTPFVSEQVPVCTSGVLCLCVCLSVHVLTLLSVSPL